MQAHTPLIDRPRSLDDAPLVSVIVRSMDRASLGAALDSIVAQTHRPIELVLVNACGAGHRPLPLSCADLRVVPVASAHGAPLLRAQAANRGLAAAQGELVLFLDDDDLLLPEHLTRLVAAMQAHPHAPAAYADAELGRMERGVDDAPERPAPWRAHHAFDSAFDALRLRFENYLPIHCVLFRPPPAETGIRFDEHFDLFEDWDFWLQLAARGDFIHVAGVSARYVLSGAAQSDVFSDTAAARAARERLYDKWRQRSGPAEHAALMERMQALHREAAQAGAQLELSRLSETELHAVVAAREAEIADTQLTLRNLRGVVAARDLEIADANAMLGNLRSVVRAREVEVANARTMQANLQTTLTSRDTDIANALTQTRALEQTIAARDKELADAAEQLQAVQDVVAAREFELARATEQLQAMHTLVAARDTELSDAAAHARGLQDLVAAREQEIANAARHAQALTDILAHRDAEIATRTLEWQTHAAVVAQRDLAVAASHDELTRTHDELTRTHGELERARAEIGRMAAEMQQLRAEFERVRAELQTELHTLHAESPWRALNRTRKGKKNELR